MPYERIVVGTDGSPGSAAAVDWTAATADACGAEVVLVHALAPLLEVTFSIPPLRSEVLVELAKEKLAEEWSEPLRKAGLEHETVLVEDYAAAALLGCCAKRRPSLLVLGRHGHTQWAPHTLGGVAHKVLTGSSCPVVIVPPATEEPGEVPDDIVVGVDGSDCSLEALDWAIRHAAAFGMRVRAVTAVFTQPYTDVAWLAPADDEAASAAASEQLGRLLEERQAANEVELVPLVTIGHSGEVLAAASQSARLVVMGSRGLGTVAGLLIGSTSHYVATRAACPVVIIT